MREHLRFFRSWTMWKTLHSRLISILKRYADLGKNALRMMDTLSEYFDRWPVQELDFKDMKGGVNLHRVVGYGKKLVDNTKVLERIEQLHE